MTLDTAADRAVAADTAVVFMVVSNEQLEAARTVAAHLPTRATVVNPYTCTAIPLDELSSVERPLGFIPTPRAIRNARITVRRALALAGGPSPVLVIGQDEGTMERVALTAARKAGARVAIMPDGVRATVPVVRHKAKKLSWKVIRLADRTLVAAGILSGRRGDFGSSAPDAILGWGPGWEQPLQGRAPAALITNCGNPRADVFTEMPPRPHAGRILLCSQPLSLPATAAPPREVAAWYAWLEAMDALGDPSVRVRLHPGERSERYDLPAGLHHLRSEPPKDSRRGPRLGRRRGLPLLLRARRGGRRLAGADQRRRHADLGRLRRQRVPGGPARPERGLPDLAGRRGPPEGCRGDGAPR